MDSRFILITLLIRLGVCAAVCSVLVRSRRFRAVLFREDRRLSEKLEMAFFIGIPFALGVVVRGTVKNFVAADVAFEGAILLGVIAGRFSGVVGGLLMSLPSLFMHEWMNLPLNVLAGFAAGWLRQISTDREAIWSFSPLFDLSIYRWIRRSIQRSFIDWQTHFFFGMVALQFVRMEARRYFPNRTFALDSPQWAVLAAIYAANIMIVAIGLKVLNNVRIEMKLEEQERLVLAARMEALQSQINPHFLFNTLNSVSSLVRFDPDTARDMIVKLASILRRLLRKGDSLVQLREEFDFIDDYLDIEVVRFGRDKLKVVKDLDPACMEMLVPSMILQPLVENSLKHGLSPKVEGGSIHLRSRMENGNVVIEVEDDGVGVTGVFVPGTNGNGIGMANISERLQVLYGDAAQMTVDSERGKGTKVRITLPVPHDDDLRGSAASELWQAKS